MSCERRCALTGCLLFFLTTVQAGAGWSHLSHSKKGVETDAAGSASVAAVSSNGKLAPHLQTDSKGVQHVLQMTIVGPHRSIVTPHLTAISPSLSIAIALFRFKNFSVVCLQARYLSLNCMCSRGKPSKTFVRLELPVPFRPPHTSVSLFWRHYQVCNMKACVEQKSFARLLWQLKIPRLLKLRQAEFCLCRALFASVFLLIDSKYQSALIYPRPCIRSNHYQDARLYVCTDRFFASSYDGLSFVGSSLSTLPTRFQYSNAPKSQCPLSHEYKIYPILRISCHFQRLHVLEKIYANSECRVELFLSWAQNETKPTKTSIFASRAASDWRHEVCAGTRSCVCFVFTSVGLSHSH